MIQNPERIAAFTSSQIARLLKLGRDGKSFGAPALLYIKEKRIEKKMGRSSHIEKISRTMSWGHFMEYRVNDLLGFEWQHSARVTKSHPTIAGWAGSPDFNAPGIVADLKAFEPVNFSELTDVMISGDIEQLRDEYPDEYWQLVSNACIFEADKCELITYMPYKSELEAIREMAWNYDDIDQFRYKFITDCDENELPWLPDDGHYKNLNTLIFEPIDGDVELLTETVNRALILLNE